MNNELNNDLAWLFNWFYSQCDGDWEHGKGIQIGTLSNPGWFIRIDIGETVLENRVFKKEFVERSEHDWFFCDIRDGFFEGDCGPFNLPEVLNIFRNWVEACDKRSGN